MSQEIILGSQSPRRKEIFNYFSLPFRVEHSEFEEMDIIYRGEPTAYAEEIALGKFNALKAQFPSSIIITADTVVYQDGKVFGKPQSKEDGKQTLSSLSGKWHTVYTSLAVGQGNSFFTGTEQTRIEFVAMSQEQIRKYQKELHCWDKAGGYAIQKAGSLAVRRIEGCYYNAMGLPIHTLRELLLNMDIDLWDYLKE